VTLGDQRSPDRVRVTVAVQYADVQVATSAIDSAGVLPLVHTSRKDIVIIGLMSASWAALALPSRNNWDQRTRTSISVSITSSAHRRL